MIRAITAVLPEQVNLIIVEGSDLENRPTYTQMFRHGHIQDEYFDSSKLPRHKVIILTLIGQHFELLNLSDRPCMSKNTHENGIGTASENCPYETDSEDNVAENSSQGANRRRSHRQKNIKHPYSTSTMEANPNRK